MIWLLILLVLALLVVVGWVSYKLGYHNGYTDGWYHANVHQHDQGKTWGRPFDFS